MATDELNVMVRPVGTFFGSVCRLLFCLCGNGVQKQGRGCTIASCWLVSVDLRTSSGIRTRRNTEYSRDSLCPCTTVHTAGTARTNLKRNTQGMLMCRGMQLQQASTSN